ncbi:MAG: hypothetical protein M3Z23_16575, partial [Acidobacteriota bacterium]|nr:hypothetical protein [Acidobacteriota bacterium]
MRRFAFCLLPGALLGTLLGLVPALADNAKEPDPNEIIKKFAAKEAAFQKARENYTYRQSVKIQELDADGNPRGKYEIVSDIVFGGDNKRS